MSGKVVWHTTMSLDGFIAGPDDTMDWAFDLGATPSALGEEMIQTTGAILVGRRWHDLAMNRLGGRSGIYGGAWAGPVLVLTHRPPESPPDPEFRYVSNGIRGAVEAAIEAAEGRNVVVFGSSLNRQCVAEGLLDEIAVHVVPVLLGDGIRFYSNPGPSSPSRDPLGGRSAKLETVSVTRSGQWADLRYRVVK